MSPKHSKPEITVVGELPEPERHTTPPARHWMKVAAEAMKNEGQWMQVRVPHLTVDRHKQASHDIRHKKLFAFRWDGFDARYIAGELYVRYDEPEVAAEPTPIRKAL